jgi:regulator of replication initiation timing
MSKLKERKLVEYAFNNLVDKMCKLEEDNDLLTDSKKKLEKKINELQEENNLLTESKSKLEQRIQDLQEENERIKKNKKRRRIENVLAIDNKRMIPTKYKREIVFNRKLENFI